MARRSLLSPLLLSGFLLACSEGAHPACGETFCLPPGATLLSREATVEDFNLYRVEAQGHRFVLYEGNAPYTSEALPKGHASVLMRMRPVWPNYLQISGPCSQSDSCEVKLFAAKITRR